MPVVGIDHGKLTVADGRHRIAWRSDINVETIQVLVCGDSVEAISTSNFGVLISCLRCRSKN